MLFCCAVVVVWCHGGASLYGFADLLCCGVGALLMCCVVPLLLC